jgi:hypothetical protein
MNRSLIIQSQQVEASRSEGVEQTHSGYQYADYRSKHANNNKYSSYQRNHVIFPGSEDALSQFLDATIVQSGKPKNHKWQYADNSNSEDALTWSCFDVLRNQPKEKIVCALDEIMEDAYGDAKDADKPKPFSFADEENIEIHIGKNYSAQSVNEGTEVDASIETDSKLIFIEAKLYGTISTSDASKPFDQIIRKLRVGLDVAHNTNKEYFFIFLDIAPKEKLLKWG